MSELNTIYRLNKEDIAKGAQVLYRAFSEDPFWEKVFNGESDVENKRLAFFEMPLRQGLYYGEAYAPSKDLEGIGVLMPNDKINMTLSMTIRCGALKAGRIMGMSMGRKLTRLFKSLEEDHKTNMGKRDYLYLSILGVDSDQQGKGYGGALLRSFIETSSKREMPLYLETETEENVQFYEKFGFKVIKKMVLPFVEHPLWEMVREPDKSK